MTNTARSAVVRLGVVGVGAAGATLARELAGGKVRGAELAAVCDQAERAQSLAGELKVTAFEEYEKLLGAGGCAAVVIATPHRFHVTQAIQAMERGLDVFCEKPAGLDVASVRQALQAAERTGRRYVVNFNRRTLPEYQALHAAVTSGAIGKLRRVFWSATNWYRTQGYFDSSPWRGTWAGEGGGVLLNQCPHLLDLWQWTCGMPCRVEARAAFGKYHTIEVEDEVTAVVDYPSGATGVFVASTGEYPGTNRLEVAGDRGRAVLEDGRLVVEELTQDVDTFGRGGPGGFSVPELRRREQTFDRTSEQRPDLVISLLQNFVDVLRGQADVLVPGTEAIRSLELGNAMVLAQWLGRKVELPIDEALYAKLLAERIAGSRLRAAGMGQVLDLRQSLRV